MSLAERDARHLWHPYTQHATEPAPLPVIGAKGSLLRLEDGREVIDAISSWWTSLHGHGHPRLVEAMHVQMKELDHVLFAGATHEPAVRLAEALLEVVPKGLNRVFYSDNGSTAVEVALKIALQAAAQRGEPERRVFVALEGGYHGDTFGGMAVGDPDPFFLPFKSLLFEVRRVPAVLGAIPAALEQLGPRAAGVILEPLVQGAAGMRMHGPELLQEVRAACDQLSLPMIADEVMVGFGRTGTLFACEQAGISPDLMCLAKGLSGGVFPIAATLAREAHFEAFLSQDRSRAFFHGHSFTGHPVGCAVALASLEMCLEDDIPGRLEALGSSIRSDLETLLPAGPALGSLRQRGGIVAFEALAQDRRQGYTGGLAPRLRALALERGVLLRPLGETLYTLPPASTTEAQARRIAEVLAELAGMAEQLA